MKRKNIFSLLLFSLINILLPFFLPPLLGRGAGGEVLAQQTHWMTFLDNKIADKKEVLRKIKQTNDSGFIVLAAQSYNIPTDLGTMSQAQLDAHYASHPFYFTLIKLDKQGGLQWNKIVDSSGLAFAFSDPSLGDVEQTTDGGYIICSVMGNVTKTDSLGNVQWKKEYGQTILTPLANAQWCELRSITQTKDGGYIAAGQTSNFGQKGPGTGGYLSPDIYLVKLDSAGTVKWAKTYGTYQWEEKAFCVRQTSDNGYILSGVAEQTSDRGFQGSYYAWSAFLLKTDSVGNNKWSKYYGIPHPSSSIPEAASVERYFINIEQTSDSGYIAMGGLGEVEYSGGPTMVKTDKLGNVQWKKSYNIEGTGGLTGVNISTTADGGYMMFGISTPWAGGAYNPSLLKLDVSGNVEWTRTYYGRTYFYNGVYYGEDYQSGSFAATKDNGYAFLSHVPDTIVGSNYNHYGFGYVIKTDSLGKNNDCQNTKIGTFTIPTMYVTNFPLSVANGSITTAKTYTSTVYPLVSFTDCLNNAITANFTPDTPCDKDSMIFYNGSNGGLFEWNFGDPTGSNNTSTQAQKPKHKYAAAGTYTVTLIAKDGTGSPTDTFKTTVLVLPSKFITVSSDVSICEGDSTLLIASGEWPGGSFGGWQPIDSLRMSYNDSTYAHPITTTQYKATAYNAGSLYSGGCTDYDSLIVTVLPKPTLTINGNTTICQGETATLSAFGGISYLWSNGATSNLITISPNINTSYTLTTYNGACSASQFSTINVLPSYTVDAGNTITITSGDGIVLNALGTSSNYSWHPAEGLSCVNCSNPTASPTKTTTYYVTSNLGTQCPQTDSVTVYVINCNQEVTVPNAFSPNGDGYNDVLYMYGASCLKSVMLTIYNRWGNVVFETSKISEGWDGSASLTAGSSKVMDTAVFVYYISATLTNGDQITKKGNVTLIR